MIQNRILRRLLANTVIPESVACLAGPPQESVSGLLADTHASVDVPAAHFRSSDRGSADSRKRCPKLNRRHYARNLLCVSHWKKWIRSGPRRSTLRNKQQILLLAFLFAAAPAFADSTSGHAKGGSTNVSFSEGFISQQDSSGNSARCNFLFGAPKENGLSASSVIGSSSSAIGRGEKGSDLDSGGASSENSVRLVDFGGNGSDSSDKDKGKGKGKGKQGGGSGDGNGPTSGNGGPSPLIVVAEPGSQSLLLTGLAGLGMLFFRRKTFSNAI